MANTKKSLSVIEIISHLRDIERVLPKRKYSSYPVQFYYDGYVSEIALNGEATKMFSFIGLNEFEPVCEWVDLPNDVAGNISLDQRRSGEIKIRLSKRFIRNSRAAMAILAHEICHKLLHYHGLYFSGNETLNELNEIYTELCSVFVGFGNLILAGYQTTESNIRNELGYIKYDDFILVKEIVENFYEAKAFTVTSVPIDTQILQDWNISSSKRQKYLEGFVTEQKGLATCLKNINLLQQALNQVAASLKNDQYGLHKKYFIESEPPESDKEQRLINQFCLAHPTLFSPNFNSNNAAFDQLNRLLDSLLVFFAKKYDSASLDKLKPNIFYCPKCGRKSESEKTLGKEMIVRCPDCSTQFYIECKQSTPDESIIIHLGKPKVAPKPEETAEMTGGFKNWVNQLFKRR